MNNPNETVASAIANTPADYWKSTCGMRAGKGEHMGSYLQGLTAEQVDEFVRELEWEVYNHSEIAAPAKGFIARGVPGVMNMAHISSLSDEDELALDDTKDAGFVEAVLRNGNAGRRVDFLVLLVGPGDEGKDVCWTFFPGDPVRPSTLKSEGLKGKKLTVREARELGVEWVKLA